MAGAGMTISATDNTNLHILTHLNLNANGKVNTSE